MADAADIPFEDESLDPLETMVDEMILRSRGERPAIRALLVELAEARAAASLGYFRGKQPDRPVR